MRKGARASSVTIQGEMVLAKFLARKGPSGWYSHACKSRADQSFRMHRPNTCESASSRAMRSPWVLPSPTKIPSSSRSEEHTSELQSLMRISYAVFCLKKKKQHNIKNIILITLIHINQTNNYQ